MMSASQHPTNSAQPTVDITYFDENNSFQHQYKPWRHDCTDAALASWMLDYYDKISDGYKPDGFTVAPRPEAAHIYQRGNCLAKWVKPEPIWCADLESPDPCTESPVTVQPRSGREGVPAVVPSATTSGARASRRSHSKRWETAISLR